MALDMNMAPIQHATPAEIRVLQALVLWDLQRRPAPRVAVEAPCEAGLRNAFGFAGAAGGDAFTRRLRACPARCTLAGR